MRILFNCHSSKVVLSIFNINWGQMAEGEQQFTIYDATTNQPISINVNSNGEDAQAAQSLQYITTSDGVQVAQLANSDMVGRRGGGSLYFIIDLIYSYLSHYNKVYF